MAYKNLTLALIGVATLAVSCKAEKKLVPAITQEVSNQELKVTGTFPEWLDGQFIRNSAIPLYKDGKLATHQFDGLAMLHSFSFTKTKVAYTNRFLRSEEYDLVINQGSSDYKGFAQGTAKTSSSGQFVKNASVNVFRYPGAYVALTEAPPPASFAIDSLETIGNFAFQDDLPKARVWESAHPHLDVENKEIINYLTEFGKDSHYVLYSMAQNENRRQVVAKIPVEMPSYMHSFSITKNYIVLTEYPLVVSPRALAKGDKPFIHNFEWLPEKKLRITVVERKSGAVFSTKTAEPIFSFHHANAYEERDGSIFLDLVAYSDLSTLASIFPQGASHQTDANWKIRLLRYKLTSDTEGIEPTVLLEGDLEFPRLHDALDGMPYRYLYMTHGEGLCKFDHETKKTILWHAPNCQATEPVFVPAPEATSEDDGIILTIVNDKSKKYAFLVALDAKSFSEIARAVAPWEIPSTFHGQFFKEDSTLRSRHH